MRGETKGKEGRRGEAGERDGKGRDEREKVERDEREKGGEREGEGRGKGNEERRGSECETDGTWSREEGIGDRPRKMGREGQEALSGRGERKRENKRTRSYEREKERKVLKRHVQNLAAALSCHLKCAAKVNMVQCAAKVNMVCHGYGGRGAGAGAQFGKGEAGLRVSICRRLMWRKVCTGLRCGGREKACLLLSMSCVLRKPRQQTGARPSSPLPPPPIVSHFHTASQRVWSQQCVCVCARARAV